MLHAAYPLTSAGGLVIAVATDHDEDTLRRIASLRQPGGTGLLLLVEAATFAGPAHRPRTAAPSRWPASSPPPGGAPRWSAPAPGSARCWSALTASSGVTVGVRR